MPGSRRFPPPWTIEETAPCFIVRDAKEQALAFVYCEDEPGRRTAAKLLNPRRSAADRCQHRQAAGAIEGEITLVRGAGQRQTVFWAVVRGQKGWRSLTMSRSKQTSKERGRSRVVTALGIAGALSLAGGASASNSPTQNTAPVILAEEEISDVSLATFYVFDKENAGAHRSGARLAAQQGGCKTGRLWRRLRTRKLRRLLYMGWTRPGLLVLERPQCPRCDRAQLPDDVSVTSSSRRQS